MVKVSDCTCCDCDSAQEKEQIKERALSSINKIYTFDNKTYWPDGTGMVTLPLPTQEQLNKIEDIGDLSDQVEKNTAGLNTANELIAGEQTQIDSLKTTLETSYQAIVQKGSANGYAGLDNNARVPLAQLYAGTSANQVPLIGKQLLANEMLVVDADGLTVRSKPIVQTLSFRGIYPAKASLPSEGNVSGDYAIVSDGTAQDDTGYYVWGYNTGTNEYEWVWTILFDANSYQLISNLVTEISDSSDDSHYPSAKAVKDYHDASIGTVEQEITDINNDLATVQTTLNEHTTGISNAISQAQAAQTSADNAQTSADNAQTTANGCYDDVSIADNVLTFTTANGDTKDITLPSRKSNILLFDEAEPIFKPTLLASSSSSSGVKGVSTAAYIPDTDTAIRYLTTGSGYSSAYEGTVNVPSNAATLITNYLKTLYSQLTEGTYTITGLIAIYPGSNPFYRAANSYNYSASIINGSVNIKLTTPSSLTWARPSRISVETEGTATNVILSIVKN